MSSLIRSQIPLLTLFTVIHFIEAISYTQQLPYLPQYAENRGLSPILIGVLFSMFPLALVVGSFTMDAVIEKYHKSDRFLEFKVVFWTQIAQIFVNVANAFIGFTGHYVFFGLCFAVDFVNGFSSGASQSCMLVIVARIFTGSESFVRSLLDGMYMLGYLFGPMIGAATYYNFGYMVAFLIVVAINTIPLIGFLVIIPEKVLPCCREPEDTAERVPFLAEAKNKEENDDSVVENRSARQAHHQDSAFDRSHEIEDAQLFPDGHEEKDHERLLRDSPPSKDADYHGVSYSPLPSTDVSGSKADPEQEDSRLTICSVLGNPRVFLCAFSELSAYLAEAFIAAMLALHLKEKFHIRVMERGYIETCIAATFILVGPVVAWFADHMSSRLRIFLMSIGLFLISVAFFMFGPSPFFPWLPRKSYLMYVAAATIGLGYPLALSPPFAESLYQSPGERGIEVSSVLLTACRGIGQLVGASTSGIFVTYAGFEYSCTIFAVFILVSNILINVWIQISRCSRREESVS